MSTDPTHRSPLDKRAHARLIQQADAAKSDREAWLYLEAAHVVGQQHFWQHLQTHLQMLRLACRLRDPLEAAGQLLRLALVPLGHLTGRLPLGNPGRSNVSAFKPMPVRAELEELINRAHTGPTSST